MSPGGIFAASARGTTARFATFGLAAAVGGAARARVERRFTCDRMVDETIAVYGEVLA